MNTPIVVFGYNRALHLERALTSLENCENAINHPLYIFCDGAKNFEDESRVQQTFEVASRPWKFESIEIQRNERNLGLANSVIQGVTKVLNLHSKVIVVEDDLELSRDFLSYMELTLAITKNHPNIFSVSGYTPIEIRWNLGSKLYVAPRIHSWGWGITKEKWKLIDWELEYLDEFFRDDSKIRFFLRGGRDLLPMLLDQIDGRIDSWAIRMAAYAAFKGEFTLYPKKTLVSNHGHDGSGIHSGTNPKRQAQKISSFNIYSRSASKIDKSTWVERRFRKYYSG
jgi:hypothetical protein